MLVIDDHPLICEAVECELADAPGLVLCGKANTLADGLRQVAAQQPDVALIDLSFPDGSGLELIKDLLAAQPGLLVVVLSMSDDVDVVHRALRAGARGYVTKREAAGNLVPAIRTVLAGKHYVTPDLAIQLARTPAQGDPDDGAILSRFSDRELEIFEMLGDGAEIGQISVRLHLSVSTVHTYCQRMELKLGVETERELLVAAVRWSDKVRPGAECGC